MRWKRRPRLPRSRMRSAGQHAECRRRCERQEAHSREGCGELTTGKERRGRCGAAARSDVGLMLSRNADVCGFVPMRGAAEMGERRVRLAGDVILKLDADGLPNELALAEALTHPAKEQWAGIEVRQDEPAAHLDSGSPRSTAASASAGCPSAPPHAPSVWPVPPFGGPERACTTAAPSSICPPAGRGRQRTRPHRARPGQQQTHRPGQRPPAPLEPGAARTTCRHRLSRHHTR